jgi:hypothetical protein
MRTQRISTTLTAATAALLAFVASANAITYSVGNNPGGPTTLVPVNSGPFGGSPNFQLNADVDYDLAAGNLLKDFTNTSQGSGGPASGIPSGQNVPIVEVFTNVGTEAWTAWDEAILSTTNGNPPPNPGFLFQSNNVQVRRNGILLNEGPDYTLSGVQYFGGGNNGYISMTIALAPASYILPSDTLEIEKRIHEVFNDGNVWALNEAARVAQYPTAVPEPAAVTLLALAVPLICRRQR